MDRLITDIIEIGQSTSFEQESVLGVSTECFRDFAKPSGFEFLAEIQFTAAFAFIRGLVYCEEAGVCTYPGSVSLVIRAFKVLQTRPRSEWVGIVIWIIQNHQNPWSPFGFQRTRDHWEMAMRESIDPMRIADRAYELEVEYYVRKQVIAENQYIRERLHQLGKIQAPASPEIRHRMIEEMEREAGWRE